MSTQKNMIHLIQKSGLFHAALPSNQTLNAHPTSAGSTEDTACPKIQSPRHSVPDGDLNACASLSSKSCPFETEFSDWIAAQNSWVESKGIPGADLRPW
jgi:hypothetical protein